ncbi:hypothetical protein JL720_6574 [Aureococcus anophagefferens]|nr:hypothetical protein JL720_6574 [Aureococcus anophagefferens]
MRVTCSALLVAVACAFAPAPQPAATRGQALRMKKPSPATEAGPLPGLSENNYAVLAGVAATGLLAPALLFAPTLLPAPAPAAKGKTSSRRGRRPAAPVLTAKPGANLGVKKATSNANEAANTGGAAKATSLNVEDLRRRIAAAPPSARSRTGARAATRGGAG